MSHHRKKTKRKQPAHSPKSASKALVDAPSRRIDAAIALIDEGRRDEGLRKLQAAIRAEPNNLQTYVLAGLAYGQAYDFERMEDVHRRLRTRAPSQAAVHHAIGETYEYLQLPDRAVTCYEAAAALPDAEPKSWIRLAALHEQAHRLDEAEALVRRVIAAGDDRPSLHLVQARIQRRLKKTAEAQTTLRGMVERLPDTSEWAAMAWGDLAIMLDRDGDYDGAIDAIGHCKRGQLAEADAHWTEAREAHDQIETLLDGLTAGHFARWRQEAEGFDPMPVALLTGFPRSGTTLLEQVLDAHPKLVSSEERGFLGQELRHELMAGRTTGTWLDVLESAPSDRIRRVRERYFPVMEYLLGSPIDGRMHLDKNPAFNTFIPSTLRVFPEMRLLVALRDPRDVVVSCYLRHLPLNATSVWFLNIERTAARYAADMKAWLRLREIIGVPWCEIRYEDSVADLGAQARRGLETLGLDWDDEVLQYRDRLKGKKRVNSPTYEAVAQPVYTRAVGRWKNYEAHLAPVLDVLEPFVREFGYE